MRADRLEIIDDRAAHKATIITKQLPIDHWHGWIGESMRRPVAVKARKQAG